MNASSTLALRLRLILLCGSCSLVWAALPNDASARNLVPEKPSVEINLNALEALRTLPPPPPPAYPTMGRYVPAEQPGVPAGAERKIPAEQPVPGYRAPARAKTKIKNSKMKKHMPVTPIEAAAPVPVELPAVEPAPQPELPPPLPPVQKSKPFASKKVIAPIAPAPAPTAPITEPLPDLSKLPPATIPSGIRQAPPPLPDAIVPPPPAQPVKKIAEPKKTMPLNAPVKTAPVQNPPAALPLPAKENPPPLPPIATPNSSVPAAPDISKLDFSKFPNKGESKTVTTTTTTTNKPGPAVPPIAAPNAAILTPPNPKAPVLVPSQGSNSPLMVPVPKDLPPLPPSVDQRMGAMFGNTEPKEQGIVSDKTTTKDPKSLITALPSSVAAPAEPAKVTPLTPPAAAPTPPKPAANASPLSIKNEWTAVNEPGTPVKVGELLPPSELPKAAPAPTPVTLPKSEIAAAPKVDAKPVPPLPVAELPKPPAETKETTPAITPLTPAKKEITPPPANVLKLPTPGAPTALPSLTAITGDAKPKSAMDLAAPKEAIDSKPLGAPGAPPTPLALPKIPTVDEGPIVKRELPEVKVGEEKKAVPPSPLALPTVKTETKTTTKTEVAKVEPPKLPPVKAEPPKPEPVKAAPPAPAPIPELPKAAPPALPPVPALPVPPKADAPAAPASEAKLSRSLSFGKDKTDLSDDAKSDLNDVVEKVKESKGSVRIVAYASGTPEESSVAKRISLSRALAIRAFLISKGVDQLAINVQALGNQVPSGDGDRADIYTK